MKLRLLNILCALFIVTCVHGYSLDYDRPAGYFEEALVIGNGKLGATVYGGPVWDRLSLNDITLWTGMPETNPVPEGAPEALAKIRELLDRGDYAGANEAQKALQGHYSENYSPLGTMGITIEGAEGASDYYRHLSLDNALLTSGFVTPSGQGIEKTYFASSPDSVMVVRVRSVDAHRPLPAVTVSLSSLLPHKVEMGTQRGEIAMEGRAAGHSFPVYYHGVADSLKHVYSQDKGIGFRGAVRVLLPGDNGRGRIEASGDTALVVTGAPEVVVLYTSETSFDGPFRNPVTEGKDYRKTTADNLDRATSRGYEGLLRHHIGDYAPLFSRVGLRLGQTPDSVAALPTDVQLLRYSDLSEANPELEALYFAMGRYLLLSCSRTPGVPANLQGLWNERLLPPWSCNYTSNINLEENYWGAETTALPELHMPLMGFIVALQRNGAHTARDYYGVEAPEGTPAGEEPWCLGQNTDLWAMTNPVGLNSGDPSWACWTMGGAWLASHIYDHYLFTLDRDFLERYYPALKGAALFCLGWLVERDGYLMTSPGTSPENVFIAPDGSYCSTSAGTTADLAITRQCLTDAAAAARVLGRDAAFADSAEAAVERLAPYRVGAKGGLQEWWVDFEEAEPTHRHQSHLYGLYPGRHLSPQLTPELAQAAHKSLELRGPRSTGWSTGWRVNLYARLLDAEAAYRTYRTLLRYISPDGYRGEDARRGGGTYPNLLDAHSPFQIDGNFGGSAGVAEMLLQSASSPAGVGGSEGGDAIDLLPALPAAWTDGEVWGLRARGGYAVSMGWKDGELKWYEITASTAAEGERSPEVRYGERQWQPSLGPGETARFEM